MCALTDSSWFSTSVGTGGFSRMLSLPFRSDGKTTFFDMAYCHRVRMLMHKGRRNGEESSVCFDFVEMSVCVRQNEVSTSACMTNIVGVLCQPLSFTLLPTLDECWLWTAPCWYGLELKIGNVFIEVVNGLDDMCSSSFPILFNFRECDCVYPLLFCLDVSFSKSVYNVFSRRVQEVRYFPQRSIIIHTITEKWLVNKMRSGGGANPK